MKILIRKSSLRSVSERVERCQRNAFIRANADDIGEVELSRARLCFPKERKEKENSVLVQAIGEMATTRFYGLSH